MRILLFFILTLNILYSQNLIEKNGKFYENKKLYTGEIKKEKFFLNRFNEEITTYKNGDIIAKKRYVYEQNQVGYTNKYIKDLISSKYIWDFNKNRILYKGYYLGKLRDEGFFDFKFKKVGIWKSYSYGDLLTEEFNYELYNEYFSNKDDFYVPKERWQEFEKKYEYKESSVYYDEKGNLFIPDKDFKYSTFNGTVKHLVNEKPILSYKYKDGFCYENIEYFYSGKKKSEMILEEKEFGFFKKKKWVGVLKNYYYNGNVKEEFTITIGKAYRSELDVLSSSFNPANTKSLSTGTYETFSTSGSFKQYYSNGQLMVEGENYNKSNDILQLKVYDKKGNRIFLQ